MISPQKHSIDNYNHYFHEAINTYLDFWCETDTEAEIIDSHFLDLKNALLDSCEYLETYMLASDLEKFKPLHTAEYDLENNLLPEKAFKGLIVVVHDKKQNKNLIIDGNHRRNTLLKHCPSQQVLVIEVDAALPE